MPRLGTAFLRALPCREAVVAEQALSVGRPAVLAKFTDPHLERDHRRTAQ